MGQNEKQKRIKLSIQLPSMALKRFIEKALKDDEFFESAIENPIGALKESGVNLDVSAFMPKDLVTFLGALAGVKELIKKKQIKEITFEKIFGQAAEIRGATIMAETERGMMTQFNKNVVSERETFASVRINFGQRLELDVAGGIETVATKVDISAAGQYVTREGFAGSRIEKQETTKGTDTGVTFHFDANQGVGSKKESSIDTYKTKDFSGISFMDIEQFINGPLISPVDLSAISAQLDTFTKIAEQTEEL